MKKILIVIITLCLINMSIHAQIQNQKYKLVDKTTNADIYKKQILLTLDALSDSCCSVNVALSLVFVPVKGQYTVYRFIATFESPTIEDGMQTFHDLLVLKTDKSNKIIEAFQYTAEWGDPPLSSDLFISTAKNIYLKDGLSTTQLRFRRNKTASYMHDLLEEQGVIQLK